MIKLFVSDMDGTLLNANHHISPETAQAVKDLQSQTDIQFMVATGRDYHSAKPLLDEHQISCSLICLNGAAIYNPQGDLLKSIPLDDKSVQRTIAYCQQFDINLLLMTTTKTYSASPAKYIQRMQAFFKNMEAASSDTTNAQLAAYIHSIEPLYKYDPSSAEEPLKLFVAGEEASVLDRLWHHIDQDPQLVVTSSGPGNIEITNRRAQKGLMLEDYVRQEGLSLDNVLAIGDSYNDQSMIEAAKYGIVMANAEDKMKAYADYIAPHHDELGVSQIIHRLIQGDFPPSQS